MNARTLEKTAIFLVKAGLWVIPILPLFLSPSMLFPFITGKNFSFRIIVEIIAALWAGLALARAEYRPRLTPLVRAVTVFVGIVFLADLFGPNPYRSFFSNYERMEGFMMLVHLYLYFIMLSAVFKSRRDWLIFLHVTLGVSVAVSFVALLQKFGIRGVSQQGGFRVDATIGNPTYLAAYLMFHVWLACLLSCEFWKRRARAVLYGAAAIFELLIIYFTATRGAVLSFLGVSFFLLLGIAVFWKKFLPSSPRWRSAAIAVLALLILVPGVFWSLRNSEFTRRNPALYRLTQYSLRERTVQSRFKIWKMSARAALERPILGWGQENYYLVFQKYYDPGLYAQEPWFDRSHNVFLDWLVHAGFPGLFAFMALFVIVFRRILLGIKKKTLPVRQGVLLMSAFAAYLLQNIFVFDNLNTYLLLFAFLAYADWLAAEGRASAPLSEGTAMRTLGRAAAARYAVLTACFLGLALASVYVFSWRPMQQSKALIRALTLNQAGSLDEVSGVFQDALAYRSFGDTEVREQMANAARGIPDNPRFTPEEKKRFTEFAIEEMRKEASRPAKDVKHLIFLASMLNKALAINPAYARESEAVLREAIKISPAKQMLYFELAQLYLLTGNADPAIEALRTAWRLDTSYAEAAVNLLRVAVVTGRPDAADEVEAGLDPALVESVDVLNVMAVAYQEGKRYPAAARVFERLIILLPKEAKYRAGYAALLAELGRPEEAVSSAREAARLDPALRAEVEKFVKSLKPAQ